MSLALFVPTGSGSHDIPGRMVDQMLRIFTRSKAARQGEGNTLGDSYIRITTQDADTMKRIDET